MKIRNDNLLRILCAKEEVWAEKKDSQLIQKLIEQFSDFNVGNSPCAYALSSISIDRIKHMVVGPHHFAFMMDDGNVFRIAFSTSKIETVKEAEESGPSTIAVPSGLQSRAGNTKYRRVLLNRSYCRIRSAGESRGVAIIGSRNVVPASNVPDELVNNVQQVLQGKSREVIVRELQRTGLNVNEAVNNLLSREDGDEAMDPGSDHILPEELIQILEHSSAIATSGNINIPGSGMEDHFDGLTFSREFRNALGSSKKGKEKEKKKNEEDSYRNNIDIGEKIEWWCGKEGMGIPLHASNDKDVKLEAKSKKLTATKIAATSWCLYALFSNGKIYTWNWDDEKGSDMSLDIVKDKESNIREIRSIGEEQNPIIDIAASNLRIAVVSQLGNIVSWLDPIGVGNRMSSATECIGHIQVDSSSSLQDLSTSDYIASVRLNNTVYWCGIYPISERVRALKEDKEKEKKKHVSFGDNATSSSNTASTSSAQEITQGSQVQLKKSPIYPSGSVALFIDAVEPMIGVLAEDYWGVAETARFRVLSYKQYDSEVIQKVIKEEVIDEDAPQFDTDHRCRKRKAPRSFSNSPTFEDETGKIARFENWNIEDVTWIHEHRKRDVMIVEFVDNNLISVKYNETPKATPYASIWSDAPGSENTLEPKVVVNPPQNVRLLRKEDVQLHTKKGDSQNFRILQKDLFKFTLDPSKPIISMVADLNGFRVLMRSKNDSRNLYICRVPVSGKMISRRRLPIHLPSVERPMTESMAPKLISFGDSRTLLLRDSSGMIVPLLRDAINGIREPPVMHAQPIQLIATVSRPSSTVAEANERGITYEGNVVCIPGMCRPNHIKHLKYGSSLLQLILYCDLDGVTSFLNRIYELQEEKKFDWITYRELMREQLFATFSDGCSNILHTAVRLCISQKNSMNVDKMIPDMGVPALFESRHPMLDMADKTLDMLVNSLMEEGGSPQDGDHEQKGETSMEGNETEGRWSGVLRARTRRCGEQSEAGDISRENRRGSNGSSGSRRSGGQNEERAGSEDSGSSCSNASPGPRAAKDEISGMPYGEPCKNRELRQKNSLAILELLLSHKAMFVDTDASDSVDYLNENRLTALKSLLSTRDVFGMTPFQLAINCRAYGAAYKIWNTLLKLDFVNMDYEEKMKYIYPGLVEDMHVNADDNPLFVLCYNDVCSFTWTGEDHINQDIYECRTCGLTGSLCCCSECALSCHRNHECKLKRTSPTAYCDCWEKCACKALIAGNERTREALLLQLVTYTRLFELPNARNEHIMLFLARTVIRQMREQNCQSKKRTRISYRSAPPSDNPSMPEHDLSPPKFARFALDQFCKNEKIVKSSIVMGAKAVDFEKVVNRDYLYFMSQNSATHLDKLAFTLMNKKLKDFSNTFIYTLKSELASDKNGRDEEVEEYVSRFIRSIIRVITLAINLSPAAASIIMGGEELAELNLSQCSQNLTRDRDTEQRIRVISSIGFSGFLPMVKRDNSKHADKSAGLIALVCRAVSMLRSLPIFAVLQLGAMADAIIAPVRYGIVKATGKPQIVGNHDPLDVLDKFFASDHSIEETMKRIKKEERAAMKEAQGKRSRKTSRRETDRESQSGGGEGDIVENDGSVSDHPETVRVRGDSSSIAPRRRQRLLSNSGTTNESVEDNEERRRNRFRSRPNRGRVLGIEDPDSEDEDEEMDEDEQEDDDDDNSEDGNIVPFIEDDGMDDDRQDNEDLLDYSWRNYEPSSPTLGSDQEDGDDDEDNGNTQNRNRERDSSRSGSSPRSPSFDGNQEQQQQSQQTNDSERPAEESNANSGAQNLQQGRTYPNGAENPGSFVSVHVRDNRNWQRTGHVSSIPFFNRSPPTNRRETAESNSGANNSGESTSSTAPKRPGSGEATNEANCSVAIAQQQLAMSFCLLVRLGCDILSKMQQPITTVFNSTNQISMELQKKCHGAFSELLKDTFDWMIMVLDSIEAKLKFNVGYMEEIDNSVPCAQPDEKGSRKEMFNYMLNLMRSASDEAKDHLISIDTDILIPLAFILDSYLVFLNCNEERIMELKQLIDQFDDSWRRKYKDSCVNVDEDLLVAFYLRPASLSYPGDLMDGAWDTISGRYGMKMLHIEQDVPLVERSDLLTMEASPSVLFKPDNENLSRKSVLQHLLNRIERKTYHMENSLFPYKSTYISMSLGIPRAESRSLMIMGHIRDHYRGRIENDASKESIEEWPAKKRIDWRMSSYYPKEGKMDKSNPVEVMREKLLEASCKYGNIVFSKWQKVIEVIGNQYYDVVADTLDANIAFDNSILLQRIARFGIKHQLFLKAAEKYRTLHSQNKEVTMDVHRSAELLVRDTMIYLNQLYNKRIASNRSNDPTVCVLAGTRLRVRFIDEPGEGTGVTRSFYTAFAEACVQMKTSPFSHNWKSSEKEEMIGSMSSPHCEYHQTRYMEIMHRHRKIRKEKSQRLRNNMRRLKTLPLNLAAPRFDIKELIGEEDWTQSVIRELPKMAGPFAKMWEEHEDTLKRIHSVVTQIVKSSKVVGRVMGILCQLPPDRFKYACANDDSLRLHVQQVCIELRADGEFDDTPDQTPSPLSQVNPLSPSVLSGESLAPSPNIEAAWAAIAGNDCIEEALFQKAGNPNFCIPFIGNGSPLRISAYRNVGRIMGICLSQGDIFPIRFARHVFSYILRQPITWMDLGFCDPQIFNSLRAILNGDLDDSSNFLCLNFAIDVKKTCGGVEKVETLLLKPNGDNIDVDKSNILEYVYRTANCLMLGPNIAALEAIREGVLDIIPESMMNGLTPEDLRLILCGTEQICIETLQNNTAFLDESRVSNEMLTRFKQLFWQVVESLTQTEKQDLVFFWTGTPSLPPSGEWQTNATVMIRPADDMLLPTANTCISRLYVPVYSSKRILKSKLLMAIKAKNFGFV